MGYDRLRQKYGYGSDLTDPQVVKRAYAEHFQGADPKAFAEAVARFESGSPGSPPAGPAGPAQPTAQAASAKPAPSDLGAMAPWNAVRGMVSDAPKLGRTIARVTKPENPLATPEGREDLKGGGALLAGTLAALVPGALGAEGLIGAGLSGLAGGGADALIRSGGNPAATAGGGLAGLGLGALTHGILRALPAAATAAGHVAEPLAAAAERYPGHGLPVGVRLSRLGEEGNTLRALIHEADMAGREGAGQSGYALEAAGIRPREMTPVGKLVNRSRGLAPSFSPEADLALGRAIRGEIPATPETGPAVDAARKVLGSVPSRARSVGLKVKNEAGEAFDFPEASPTYFPHTLPQGRQAEADAIQSAVERGHFGSPQDATAAYEDWKALSKSPDAKDRGAILAKAIAAKTGADPETVLGQLARFAKASRTPGFGNLERAREFDFPFFDPSPARVLPNYAEGAEHRLATAQHLGPEGERLNAILAAMNPADRSEASRLVASATGANAKGEGGNLLTWLDKFSPFMLSPISAVRNLTQSLNTAADAGVGPTLRALPKVFTPEGYQFARTSGSLPRYAHGTAGDLGHGGLAELARTHLTSNGFTPSERFNRTLAPLAYREAALAHGVPPTEILNRAAAEGTAKTQFLGRPLDLPMGMTSNKTNRAISRFKGFGYQQAGLTGKMLDPRQPKGDLLRKLGVLGVAYPAAGEGIADLVAGAQGRERPDDWRVRYLQDLAQVGPLGIAADAVGALGHDGGLADFLLGAPVGRGVKLAEIGSRAVQGKVRDNDKRYLLRQIPDAGQVLAPRLVPYE